MIGEGEGVDLAGGGEEQDGAEGRGGGVEGGELVGRQRRSGEESALAHQRGADGGLAEEAHRLVKQRDQERARRSGRVGGAGGDADHLGEVRRQGEVAAAGLALVAAGAGGLEDEAGGEDGAAVRRLAQAEGGRRRLAAPAHRASSSTSASTWRPRSVE